jgi:hypothetical protein
MAKHQLSMGRFASSSLPQHPLRPHPHPLKAVQLRSHIQKEVDVLVCRPRASLALPLIKINYILDPASITPLHDPIMPIKRLQLPHHPRIPLRLWRACTRALAAEARELRPAAVVGGLAFPAADERPGALVDGVMDWDDVAYGREKGIRVRGGLFLHHGVVELGFGRVDPVAGWVGACLGFAVRGGGAQGGRGGGAGDGGDGSIL